MNISSASSIRGAALHGFVVLAFLVSLVAWSLSPLTGTALAQSTPGAPPAAPLADVVATVSPAVVTVYNLTTAQGVLGGEAQPERQGVGSGFIINAEGYVVTNWHVTVGGDAYAVQFSDGQSVEAELVGDDPRDDLAVLRIAPESVPATVSFGDSDALRPGDPEFAIGSPLGDFANTVTEGIVSGLGRDQLNTSDNFCQVYADLIQHDASINPGNSGGPLFNAAGQVIGVNTLGLPADESGLPLQGLFFAVPGNLVSDIAQQLIATGQIAIPYVGVRSFDVDPAVAAELELRVDQGSYIDEVTGESPAQEAGLQQGDVITAIDGRPITQEESLGNIVLDYDPGNQIALNVIRDGEEETVNLTLGEVPQSNFDTCELQEG